MSLSVVTNVGSLLASNELADNQISLNETIAQLSSGKRIVNAQDDPAGLVLATEEQGLLGAFGKAQTNASNATSFLQTADGALSNIANLLQTAQQLATEASDGSFSSSQLSALDSQYQAILSSITQIVNGTTFNGTSLLTGSSITFQIGATNSSNDQLAITLPKVDITTLAINGTSLTTQANAQAALGKVTTALATVAGDRGTLGASEQQLSAVSSNLQSTTQNLTSALSTIQDANVAQTFADFTKYSVIQQVGIQVLRQADATPNQLVALFQ
jgi:flagellin